MNNKEDSLSISSDPIVPPDAALSAEQHTQYAGKLKELLSGASVATIILTHGITLRIERNGNLYAAFVQLGEYHIGETVPEAVENLLSSFNGTTS
jgi:hypothetical protein